MKNPRFWRNAWIAAALIGLLAVTAAFLMPDAGKGFTLQAVLGIGGLTLAPIAGVRAIMLVFELRRYERLDRGEGVIARWTIDPATWRAFAVLNRALQDGQSGGPWRANFVGVPDDIPRPIDIVVSREAVRVGAEYHALGTDGLQGAQLLAGTPAVIEIDYVSVNPDGPDTCYVLRFPVAARAERQAHAVIAHLRTPVPMSPFAAAMTAPARAADRNPRKARNIALTVAAIGVATGAAVVLQADAPWVKAAMKSDLGAVLVLLPAVAGPIVAIGALILALAWHLRSRA